MKKLRSENVDANPRIRSLPISEWPEADRLAWADARRPGVRFKAGGTASHLTMVSQEDFAGRYGAYLGFLQRRSRFQLDAAAASQVTAQNVDDYLAELKLRVSSVTQWNCIYKLRRAAQLLAPKLDFGWLAEVERDLALVMQPRSKLDRLVFAGPLMEAGLTLMAEAQRFATSKMDFARRTRNGLMIAILATFAPRITNFASLEIGTTFRSIAGSWWITLPRTATKSRRPIEAKLPKQLNSFIEMYLNEARPILLGRNKQTTNMLWISSTTGQAMTKKNLGTLVSKITSTTLGVDVSPHLFRTSVASSAPAYAPGFPHLATGVLGHSDPRVTDQEYTVVKSVFAARLYGDIITTELLEDT
jgi:hypothetical protein